MISSVFRNIKIAGIASVAPVKEVDCELYCTRFGEKNVKRIMKMTGVRKIHRAIDEQTSGDLAYEAAARLLRQKNVKPDEIGAIVFLTTCHDYIVPSTAGVIQKRLGVTQDSLVFDINLGCSAYVYGLETIAALMSGSNIKKALLLTAETNSKLLSPEDNSVMLFGDAGSATLLEKKDDAGTMRVALKSDGNRYDAIYVRGGGFRHRFVSEERVVQSDGVCRSDYDLHMDGGEVFNFTMTDVVGLFSEFMDENRLSIEDFDSLVLHQASHFVLKHLASSLKMPMDKVPLSLDEFGNTGAATIPLTLCKAYGYDDSRITKRILASGFGVGLSWGIADFLVSPNDIMPIEYTDEYYKEG